MIHSFPLNPQNGLLILAVVEYLPHRLVLVLIKNVIQENSNKVNQGPGWLPTLDYSKPPVFSKNSCRPIPTEIWFI